MTYRAGQPIQYDVESWGSYHGMRIVSYAGTVVSVTRTKVAVSIPDYSPRVIKLDKADPALKAVR